MSCLLAILIFLAGNAVSWAITCGLVYLITLCFGWAFSWTIATGIWFVIMLARSIFSHTTITKTYK